MDSFVCICHLHICTDPQSGSLAEDWKGLVQGLEWYLIYRNEKIMISLVPGLGQQTLYVDSTGINLCLEITK